MVGTMKRDYFFFFFVFFLTTFFLAMLGFSFWLTPGRIITESAMRARASVRVLPAAQRSNTNARPQFFRRRAAAA